MITTLVQGPGKAKIVLDGTTPAVIGGINDATVIGTSIIDRLTLTGVLRGTIGTAGGNDVVNITTGYARGTDTIVVDTGIGNDAVTFRAAGSGRVMMKLGDGNDMLNIAGSCNAEVDAGTGNDTVTAAFSGTYVLHGGAGTDTLILAATAGDLIFDRLTASNVLLRLARNPSLSVQFDGFEAVRLGNTVLTVSQLETQLAPMQSGATQQTISGAAAAERLTGTAQNDIFYGGDGVDTLVGGDGDDRYQTSGAETIVELANGGVDSVLYALNGTYQLGANLENLVLQNAANRTISSSTPANLRYLGYTSGAGGIGNELNNSILGSAADNMLDGRGGNDILTGGAGKDIFVFGLGYGNDRVTDFAPGTDHIRLVSGPLDWASVSTRLSDSALGAVLNLGGGNTLTFAGVQKSRLSAGDFEFAVDMSAYRLTFADEFTSFARFNGRSGLTGGTWRTATSAGDGTLISPDEDMAFVDTQIGKLGLNPFSVADGVLSITATWRPDIATTLGGKQIASGVITTEGGFAQQYGYFEARLKLPAQYGGFPAFWMLPTDGTWPPEIDIIEQIGRLPGVAYQMGGSVPLDTTQWHTYGLEWTAGRLAWFVDGQMTQVVETTAFNKPMYILLNYALGGSWAGTVPTPSQVGASLGSMQVDYVRAYERVDSTAPRATVPDGAPDVTFSVGKVVPGGTPAVADSWHYIADTTGRLYMDQSDNELSFASLSTPLAISINNDRALDRYIANVTGAANSPAVASVQVTDSDGGTFTFNNLLMAELHLGGSKASVIDLKDIQGGWVQTGSGGDVVRFASHKMGNWGQTAIFKVETGDGNDRVTGWSQATGRLDAYGGAGNDTLVGTGANSDLLAGGPGNDSLDGGVGGADIFLFTRGEDGYDRISGFSSNDQIKLVNFKAVEMTKVDIAAGVEVRLPGETILVLGYTAATLGDWAFRFS